MVDKRVGEAKAVLVFGDENDAVSVLSSVSATAHFGETRPALEVIGSVSFAEKTLSHLRRHVVPLVERITAPLGVPTPSFEISVANLNVAALRERGLRIQGSSADAPVFLALLSASLGLPIFQDVVASGQIASSSGQLRLVSHLPFKIEAARRDPGIRRFIHPVVDADSSLKDLSPQERERLLDFLRESRDRIELIAARDVHDLLRAACPEEGVLIAALEKGYFGLSPHHWESESPLSKSVTFLSEELEKRYWKCLEKNLQIGDRDEARPLIESRIQFHTQRKEYPQGFGAHLENLVRSLPPWSRRTQTHFPLVPADSVLRLLPFASPEDLRDIRSLINAVLGDRLSHTTSGVEQDVSSPLSPEARGLLNTLLVELDPRTLARKVGIPVDSARASFVLDSCVVSTGEEFLETITSFYLHLLRWTRQVVEPADPHSGAVEAVKLLEKAFSRKGGGKAAQAEALDGSQGGMRFVLDALADQYKADEERDYTNCILKETLDSLDYERRLALMAEVIEFLRPHLPDDLGHLIPEQLVGEERTVILRLLGSITNMNNLLLSL